MPDTDDAPPRVAAIGGCRLVVTGVVQGVGFRPFVHRLATELGLRGRVGNDSASVVVEVSGPAEALDELAARLVADAPPLAAVDRVHRSPLTSWPLGDEGFSIVESRRVDGPRTPVPPDVAVCDACLREMWNPADRRHRHPFITCTDCGPRFTIITDLPYDRPNTTMAGFAMCRACRAEYEDPDGRRHHAQPIACPDCGPTLGHRSVGEAEARVGEEALTAARRALVEGRVLAVKGLGGFHLACDATDPGVVDLLRARKHRPDKPFAVMVADLDAACALAEVSEDEAAQLTSPARPIVLLRAHRANGLAAGVAPANPMIGVVLAYTPVHHLLFERSDVPLVMTSANPAGEPIAHQDDRGDDLLGTLADDLLGHDRPIATPCDDSVVRVVDGSLLPIRRARGYAPLPVPLDGARRSVLATGAELKNTFCVASPSQAWVSQHIGDLGSLPTLDVFARAVPRFQAMYGVRPEVVAVDAHPGYTGSRWARREHGSLVEEVHHHHAHIAAVMAEHRLPPHQPVLGLAFDGTGYGPDGTIWGGEVLVADADGFERVAHLATVPLPGGDAAVADPARVALAHLHAAGIDWDDDLAPVRASVAHLDLLHRQLERGVGCVPTSSMGRLFDAVASLLGLRHHITFEAQAAIDLEHAALAHDALEQDATPGASVGNDHAFTVADGVIDPAPVLRAVVADLRAGTAVTAVAAGFHRAVADLVLRLASEAADRTGRGIVVLTGGVFQNALLTRRCLAALRAADLDPRTHRLVPPNDGGLALGQAFVAAHRRHTEER